MMKNQTKAACGIACLVTVLLFGLAPMAQAQSTAMEGKFNVHVYLRRLPVKTDPGWDAAATAVVQEMRDRRTLLPNDLGFRLTPDMVTEPQELTNTVVWIIAIVSSKNPSDTFSLADLVFSEKSSDQDNVFNNQYVLASINNLAYSRHAAGELWSVSGDNSSNTVYDNMQPGTNQVNRLYFIGMQTLYFYPYSTNEVQAFFDGFTDATGYTNGLTVSLSCSVVQSNTVVAVGQRTLATRGVPNRPKLTVTDFGNTVRIGFQNMDPDRSGVLLSSTDLRSWSEEITFNAGDEIFRTKIFATPQHSGYQFFDAQLQWPQ